MMMGHKSVNNVLITVKPVIHHQTVHYVTRIYLTKDLTNQQIVLVIKAILTMAQIHSANNVIFNAKTVLELVLIIVLSVLIQSP
jgi:hypothetical protein